MALQSNGAISLGDIRSEYGLTGAISLGSFLGEGSQPPLPASGAISIGDFYSNIARSAKLTLGKSTGSFAWYGFSEANMLNSTPLAAFGATTKNDIIVLGNNSKRVAAIAGQAYPSVGTPRVQLHTVSTSSTQSDWTNMVIVKGLPEQANPPSYSRNQTVTTYPNKFVSYLTGASTSTINSEEAYRWNSQIVPEQGSAATGGLYYSYFAYDYNPGTGIGDLMDSTTPTIFFS